MKLGLATPVSHTPSRGNVPVKPLGAPTPKICLSKHQNAAKFGEIAFYNKNQRKSMTLIFSNSDCQLQNLMLSLVQRAQYLYIQISVLHLHNSLTINNLNSV